MEGRVWSMAALYCITLLCPTQHILYVHTAKERLMITDWPQAFTESTIDNHHKVTPNTCTQALVTTSSLIKLSVSTCLLRITEENGPILAEMLQTNKTLRSVDILLNKEIIITSIIKFYYRGFQGEHHSQKIEFLGMWYPLWKFLLDSKEFFNMQDNQW